MGAEQRTPASCAVAVRHVCPIRREHQGQQQLFPGTRVLQQPPPGRQLAGGDMRSAGRRPALEHTSVTAVGCQKR